MDVFSEDLETFSNDDLDILRRYYHLSPDLSRTKLIQYISNKHMNNYVSSNLDPDEEEIARQEQAERMRKFREQQQRLQEMVRKLPETQEETDTLEKCFNETDPITLDTWTTKNQPSLTIRFVDSVTDLSQTREHCYDMDAYIQWIEQDENEARNWVPEYDTTSQRLSELTTVDMSLQDTGANGVPGSDILYKLPDRQAYFLENEVIQYNMAQTDTYDAIQIAKNKLIGNPAGTFFIGQVHGQSPGYPVYILVDRKANLQTILHDVLQSILDLYILDPEQQQEIEAVLQTPDVSVDQLMTTIHKYYEDGIRVDEALQITERTNNLIDYLENQNSYEEDGEYEEEIYTSVHTAMFDPISNTFKLEKKIPEETTYIQITIDRIDDPRVVNDNIELIISFEDDEVPLDTLDILNNNDFEVFIDFTVIHKKTVEVLSLQNVNLDMSTFPVVTRSDSWIGTELSLDFCTWNTMSTDIQTSFIKHLSLKDCDIDVIPLPAFPVLSSLSLVEQVDTIPRSITTLNQLRFLNLKDNGITSIPRWFLDYMETLPTLIMVNLKNNEINCSNIQTSRTDLRILC